MSPGSSEGSSSQPALDSYQRAISAITRNFRPDSITGEVEFADIVQYISTHIDDPDVQIFLSESNKRGAIQKEERKKVLAEFDIKKLKIQFGAAWLISLEYAGLTTDPRLDDNWSLPEDPDPEEGTQAPGLTEEPRQKFQMFCYIREGPGTEDGTNSRHVAEFIGLPTSKQIEDFVKVSMAAPLECYSPGIPTTLAFSYNLNVHKAALMPFLHSLPFPCSHIFETAEIRNKMADQGDAVAERRFREYIEYATKLKDAGNEAYSKRDRKGAVAKYKEAIDELDKLLLKMLSEAPERDKETKDLITVCWANSSAAKLLDIPGEGKDAEGAKQDAEKALKFDREYAKGYMRLSRAHEVLGDTDGAQDALVRGLRRKSLQDHWGLADHLISLQTEGKGLPKEKDTFKIWLASDRVSRMSDLGGAWQKRCQQHARILESKI
ncbi:hypothetical protein CPB84DRAFT_1788774 [Gymnopilus junonius]|uniref:Uncharacterized protein n=1 Tax=Gymnopilus junonius TaxID=109634 RepID=A0A9P5NH20_GYMJU|nr:hypothetical protein CPB84DRAFT_1788774 [Gymnopilus junonius]